MTRTKEHSQDERDEARESDGLSGVPEIIRRFAALGLSGFFTTESALRKALGDTVPKEWVDFASEQGERTRHELFDRIAVEIGRVLEGVEPSEIVERLLEGRTIEVNATIRLGAREPTTAGSDARSSSATPARVGVDPDTD